MPTVFRPRFALLAGLLALSSLAAVAEEARYNQVSLRAEASREVANDRMFVTLYSEAQHEDPGQLAAQTTRAINEALRVARRSDAVTINQGSRSSYPVYDEKGQRISGWRERAELQLESADFAALSKLTGELLANLKMGSMHFGVSDEARKQSEDELLGEAIAAFRARAQLATEALGGSGYRLVRLDLNSHAAPPMLRNMAMKTMTEAMAMDAPEIEAGTRRIGLAADGVVEVQLP